ncbi:MAG: hypothetical protein JWN50_44 [Parcubacteria group bacterium]|nr:hypothetical protein [Parcubacteria group bacterium]
MIAPEIYSMEKWCFHIDPWVERHTENGTVRTWGTEACGEPKTMALIQSWFDDRALPSGDDLKMILLICDPKQNPFLNYPAEKLRLQAEALERMYAVIDDFTNRMSRVPNKDVRRITMYPVRISMLLFEYQISNLLASLSAIPTRKRQEVLTRLMETVRAEKPES